MVRLTVCTAVLGVVLVFSAGCPDRSPSPGERRTFDGMSFQWIPPGTFAMGSPGSESSRMGSNPSFHSGVNRPVEHLSWNDIQDFLTILNAATSEGTYRLPTEAEWEHAYRAGTTTRFYWGDDPSLTTVNQHAWHIGNSGGESHPVGEKLPNPWGLYDMGGNVFENCQDRYGPYPTGSVTDPEGPSTGDQRVQRGGAWEHEPGYCRAAERGFNGPALSTSYDGFRLLRTDAETNVVFRVLQKAWRAPGAERSM